MIKLVDKNFISFAVIEKFIYLIVFLDLLQKVSSKISPKSGH